MAYDRKNNVMKRETLEKLIGAFNLLCSFDFLRGRAKNGIQQEIMKEINKAEMKAQANQDSIENLESSS